MRARRDSGAVRDRCREMWWRRRGRRQLTLVAVAVPAPFELEYFGTTGERTRQAHRTERRFAPRGLEAHGGVVPVRLPTAGHRVDELLGKLDDRSVQRKIG